MASSQRLIAGSQRLMALDSKGAALAEAATTASSTTHAQAGSFPSDFVWGGATASYQIEGAVREDGRSESIWDRFSHTPGKTANGDTGDIACDHYHRWRDDIAVMRDLGLKAYRFSIAWPRILPDGRGRLNMAGLDFYDRLVDGLLDAGITPWATLYHWDLPQVVEDAGGWPNRATADAFAEYADVVSSRLGDRVKHWITLNEPWCSAFLGYALGHHAPGRTHFPDALAATHTLLLGHGLAVPIIRRNSADARVGITLNPSHTYAASDDPADQAAARRWDGYFNRWFLDPLYGRGYPEDMVALYGDAVPVHDPSELALIAAPTDFLGVNYYTPAFVADDPNGAFLHLRHQRPEGEYTEMDWLVYPPGLRDLLLRLAQDYPVRELYVTENGAAYPDQVTRHNGVAQVADPARVQYFAAHLAACAQAIARGAPLKGYFAWSLMDNFEWAFGYTKRFGIVYVDYATQERIVKESGRYFGKVIAANALLDPVDS